MDLKVPEMERAHKNTPVAVFWKILNKKFRQKCRITSKPEVDQNNLWISLNQVIFSQNWHLSVSFFLLMTCIWVWWRICNMTPPGGGVKLLVYFFLILLHFIQFSFCRCNLACMIVQKKFYWKHYLDIWRPDVAEI